MTIGSVVNGVLIGHQSQLFLAGGAHAVLDFASGELAVPAASFAAFAANIRQRTAWADERGAGYLHVIFPDKQSVLLEAFPLPPPICLGERYLHEAPEVAGRVLYLRDLLRLHQAECFLRTDTHLADHGVILAAMAVAERLTGLDCRSRAGALLERLTLKRALCGDLGSKLTPPATCAERYVDLPWQTHAFSNKLSGNNGLVDIWINPGAALDKRLLIFGDSFGRSMARMLSCLFKCTLFTRTPFFHVDIADQMRPDYIITENIERYLTHVQPDEDRPNFFMYPYLAAGYLAAGAPPYSPAAGFAEALSAVLSYPRKPYRDFIARFSTG